MDRLPLHAHLRAFVVSAELASVPLSLVDGTVAVFATRVYQVLANRALEEPLASLAAGRTDGEYIDYFI